MHKNYDITIDSITKIEGNAKLVVRVRDNKVSDLKFIIADYRRFYTTAVLGKHFKAIPAFLSRICGTCSLAHQLASIESIERALGIYNKLSEQTKTLRELSYLGTMIRDHCLHLYIFVLPDYLEIDSVLDIEDDSVGHQLLHDGFDLKATGNKLTTTFAGAVVHSPFPTVGGFVKFPKEDEYKGLTSQLEKSRTKILRGIEFFASGKKELIRNTDYIALINDNFSFLDGKISINNKKFYEEDKFKEVFEEVVVPYSQSKSYQIASSNEDYLTGSLARFNLNKKALNKRTIRSVQKYLDLFPSNNIYNNNLAQAIEVLHSIDRAIEILKTLKIREDPLVEVQTKAGEGIGVIEAPRGTLYHKITLDSAGIAVDSDVIVPTSQNQINIENDLKKFFQDNLNKLSEKELKQQAEEIIRTYDPCMSCATNFLEIEYS